jgi:hypothetical protein
MQPQGIIICLIKKIKATMMISKSGFIGLLVILSLMACNKEKDQLGKYTGDLTGNWSNPIYTDSIVTYERSESLPVNEYGFSLNENYTFVEHKNSGWCGTPPVEYALYHCNWTKNDSLLLITVGYWGGMVDYKWKIVSVDQNHLSIIVLQTNYH